MNLLQYIRQIIKDNEKVDCFSISMVINKNNKNVANMDREIAIKANSYPKAREIKKLYENEIRKIILQNKLYNAKVYVHFICKIGTYKRKDIINANGLLKDKARKIGTYKRKDTKLKKETK